MDDGVRTVRVGVYDNEPKIYRDAEGNIRGFWADITNYIARKENWNVVYVYDSWENNLKRLDDGKIDLMVDVAISEERKSMYYFNNETALIAWGLFYTRKGVKLDSVMDLEGKNIAVMTSGILYSGPLGLKDMLASFSIKANIINVDFYSDVFKMLSNGQADVGVVNYFYGITNEDKYKVDRTNIIFQPAELKYAMNKNNPENDYLKSAIDSNLKEIKNDPDSIYHQSIRQNFGRFVEKVEILSPWAKYAIIIIGSLLMLSLFILISMKEYHHVLKRQVKEKTSEIEFKNAILTTEQDTSPDGILVVDPTGKILLSNKRFVEIWGVPQKIIDFGLDEKALKFVTDKLVNPDEFLKKVEYLYRNKNETSRDEISLKDGRTLERYSSPMFNKDNNECYGRVWYFHDITERNNEMELLKKTKQELENTLEDLYTVRVNMEEDLRAGKLHPENEKIRKQLDRMKKTKNRF